MWNHAPAMWSAMKAHGVTQSKLSDQRAADLFAFLYSAKYFDRPGDAGRGKRAFESNACAVCHTISRGGGTGPPVSEWNALNDPIALIEAMWNHAGAMRKQVEAKQLAWPQLTSQELTDILVYLQNLPANRNKPPRLSLAEPESGEALFRSKSCAGCHTGKLSLENRLRGKTLTDIAAAMWNHAPLMERTPVRLEQDEMRSIVSYLWARQFFQEQGDPAHGKRVFSAKRCASCHGDSSSGAPDLAKMTKGGSATSMISALWEHGPRMLDRMRERNVEWPRFNTQEMTDLIAYLRSTR
jgi:mono/diheme cytochrome c family protein